MVSVVAKWLELVYVLLPGNWDHWDKKVKAYAYPSDSTPEYSSILVPNVDNVRTEYLISIIAKQNKAVLLIGEQGTAKTVMINGFMHQYNSEYHLAQSLNFSSATTPFMFQVTSTDGHDLALCRRSLCYVQMTFHHIAGIFCSVIHMILHTYNIAIL